VGFRIPVTAYELFSTHPEIAAAEPAKLRVVPVGKGPHEQPSVYLIPKFHEPSPRVLVLRHLEAQPEEDPFGCRAVSWGEEGGHPAHGLDAVQPRVGSDGVGQQPGGGGHLISEFHRPRDADPLSRHGWNVLVPEVKLENLCPSRDFDVSQMKGGCYVTYAHAEDAIRVVAELEDLLPFSQ